MSKFKKLQIQYINGEPVFNFGGLVPPILFPDPTPPGPSPTPSPTATITPTPTITPTITPTNTPSPTPTLTPTPSLPSLDGIILTEGSDYILVESGEYLAFE